MALVTVTEAAKLTGKSVKSIYAATTRKKNPLSFSHNSENAKVIDTSELQRVYGALGQSAAKATPEASNQEHIELLLARKEVEHLQQLLALKDEQIKDFRESLKLLEFKPERKTGFFSNLFGNKG
jgi:hypothetical protein